MRIHSIKPTWRSCDETITFVAEPAGHGFFDKLKDKCARFALHQDGAIWWGDAYDVLHQDIVRYGEAHVRPILVGTITRLDGHWYMTYHQWFPGWDASWDVTMQLLNNFSAWVSVCQEIGEIRAMHEFGEVP